jgi:thiol-disulfide isomerase/thioredoxin
VKKTKLLIILLIGKCIFCTIGFTQSTTSKPLSVGDHIADSQLKGFLSDSSKRSKLSDFYRGKLLLIDLSATWCSPCVESWPELKKFSIDYKNELNLLIVTQEKRQAVERFLKGNATIRNLNLNFIVENNTKNLKLFKEFPVKTVPQVVWVNSEGMVIAITDKYKVTKENIERAIKDKNIKLIEKKDDLNFDPAEYELTDSLPVFKSILTRYKPAIQGVSRYLPSQNQDDVKSINDIFYSNTDLSDLYFECAFHNTVCVLNKDHMIWEVPDSIRMKYDYYNFYREKTGDKDNIAWLTKNGFCYELKTAQLRTPNVLYSKMINDLNDWFSLNGRFEKRLLSCWILTSSDGSVLKTKSERPEIIYEHGLVKHIGNQPVSKIVYFLNQYITSKQIVDETNISFNVDIDFSTIKIGETAESLNSKLAKYHLRIDSAERTVEVFVIGQQAK